MLVRVCLAHSNQSCMIRDAPRKLHSHTAQIYVWYVKSPSFTARRCYWRKNEIEWQYVSNAIDNYCWIVNKHSFDAFPHAFTIFPNARKTCIKPLNISPHINREGPVLFPLAKLQSLFVPFPHTRIALWKSGITCRNDVIVFVFNMTVSNLSLNICGLACDRHATRILIWYSKLLKILPLQQCNWDCNANNAPHIEHTVYCNCDSYAMAPMMICFSISLSEWEWPCKPLKPHTRIISEGKQQQNHFNSSFHLQVLRWWWNANVNAKFSVHLLEGEGGGGLW